jgi:hypothetical protein
VGKWKSCFALKAFVDKTKLSRGSTPICTLRFWHKNFFYSVATIPDPWFVHCEINHAKEVSLLSDDKYTDDMAI